MAQTTLEVIIHISLATGESLITSFFFLNLHHLQNRDCNYSLYLVEDLPLYLCSLNNERSRLDRPRRIMCLLLWQIPYDLKDLVAQTFLDHQFVQDGAVGMILSPTEHAPSTIHTFLCIRSSSLSRISVARCPFLKRKVFFDILLSWSFHKIRCSPRF